MKNEVITAEILSGLEQLGEAPALSLDGHEWSGNQVLAWTKFVAENLSEQLDILQGKALLLPANSCKEEVRLLLHLVALKLGIGFENEAPTNAEGEPLAIKVQTPDLLKIDLEELSLLLTDKGLIEADTAEAYFTLYKSQQESLRVLQGSVGVFSDLNKFSRFAIFAAWSCGLAVYLQSPEINPAKALVVLERLGFSGVTLPATLLKGLVAHPAIALTNLKNLQCLLYETEVLLAQPLLQNARRVLASEIAGWVCSETDIEPVAKAEQALTHKFAAITESVAKHPAVANSATVPLTGGDRWAVFAQAKVQEKIQDKPGMPDMAGLFEGINTELDTEFAHLDLEHAVKVTEQLNATALLSMLNAFSHLRLFCDQRSVHSLAEILETPPVAQQHRALIKRWIRVLQEQQLLSDDGDSWRVEVDPDSYSDTALAQAWDQLEQDWRALSGASKTIDYARANAEQLPDLIRGKVQAVHLLFPRGSTELASALYREGIAARYQQRAVSALLKSILNNREGQPQPLKILEVGAGTGATTQALLPVLDDASGHIQFDYQFTDISAAFLDSFFAQHGDQEQRPWLRRGLFDIDRSLRSQGFSPNSFDVIIAGGVFNAAHNTDASLRRVAELLRPGGWFIMTEPTSEEFWVMASQAFMLVDAVDERTDSGATFLSLSQWHNALEAAGLELALDLPVSEHPLSRQGHRFFACRAKQNQMRLTADCLAEYIDHFDSDICIEVLDQLPLTLDGEVDNVQLQEWAQSMGSHQGDSSHGN
ncbi:class I SAM-dependent methyltransferase [Microbulbifer sp. SSSA005]|uniref:class I SAM-dependent methyltransferase n=1 Tax=Microbulbifer sp. SSSA005 TaxID=3243378 RepID=UPI004039CBD5